MKKFILTLALAVTATLSTFSVRADDTNAAAATTNAVAAASTNAPAAPAPAPMPAASLDQRISSLEAYISNGDPTAPLKDTNGNIAVTSAIINGSLTNSTGGVVNYPGAGHNAWILTSTALVLFMTLPGLALFYGGMVRKKNVLSVLAQCFLITGLVTILWVFVGYGMIFGGTGTVSGSDPVAQAASRHVAMASEDAVAGWVGSPKICWMLKNVTSAPNGNYSYWVSENVVCMFQLMFAIITPALIIGSIAERMKFKAIFVFMTLWMLIVYFTQGHAVWGINGAMNGVWNAGAKIHAMDFAGGTVVHMTSGFSALTLCLILGKRKGFGKVNFAPHSLVLTFIGTGMLWVGWYGFNSGSALAGDVIAANAFTTTTIATAIASFVWPMWEWLVKGKPSVLGFCSGAVAGLVVITPACGYVTPQGSIWIGIAAGTICWFMCYKVKGWMGYDDALDTFGVHAIGGATGAIMTGMLARTAANPNFGSILNAGSVKYVNDTLSQPLVWEQCKAVGITIVLSVVGTVVIAYITKVLVGLRPSEEVEEVGLDESEHGEVGYHS
ncbi:MAG TPA: ammonium transporter [Candidatus Acidoferrales bacterium]|jgi:Amt family ammonium transporter|nr:ammonium transporter [Candidatus Acidoferrales bacterium]